MCRLRISNILLPSLHFAVSEEEKKEKKKSLKNVSEKLAGKTFWKTRGNTRQHFNREVCPYTLGELFLTASFYGLSAPSKLFTNKEEEEEAEVNSG